MLKKPIVILTSSPTSYFITTQIAQKLYQEQENIVIIYDGTSDEYSDKISKFSYSISANYIAFEQLVEKQTIKEVGKLRHKLLTFNLEFNLGLNESDQEKFWTHYYINQRKCLAALILQPKLLIVNEDGVSGNCYLIKAARDKKIPVLNCPYGYGTSQDFDNMLELREASNQQITSDSNIGKYIKKHYPQWIKRGRFEGALLFDPIYILVREKLNLTIKNSWFVHGGYANYIAVESAAMMKHYLQENVCKEKLILTGTPYCDVVYHELKKHSELDVAYQNVTKIKPIQTSLLISWPPSYHNERGHLCEFKTYDELTQVVFNWLNSLENIKITISIHPALPDEQRQIINRYVEYVTDEDIIKLIPHHDIYISCFSSTIRWAVALAKPVVNYDIYQFDLDDYQEAKGVITVANFYDFKCHVQKLIQDMDYFHSVAKEQRQVSDRWGVLDGENLSRIYNFIQDLT